MYRKKLLKRIEQICIRSDWSLNRIYIIDFLLFEIDARQQLTAGGREILHSILNDGVEYRIVLFLSIYVGVIFAILEFYFTIDGQHQYVNQYPVYYSFVESILNKTIFGDWRHLA